jgi:hypothetical protein
MYFNFIGYRLSGLVPITTAYGEAGTRNGIPGALVIA